MPNTRLNRSTQTNDQNNPCGCGEPPTEAELQSIAAQDPQAKESFDLSKAIAPTRPANPSQEGDRIVGGETVTNDFYDCCAVGSQRHGFFCTGTLIAPNLVVTAGHCEEVEQVFFGDDVEQDGTIIQVKPGGDIRINGADLRVLVLESNAPSPFAPRHVAQGHEVRADLHTALLVGFGNVDFNGRIGYGRKRKVEVPITSLACPAGDDATFGCERRTEMVAGQRGLNRDSCTGDSGGPLYIRAETGEYFLLGATSRGIAGTGRACGDGGIYVRVDQFLDQIQQKTGIAVPGPLL